MNETPKQHWLVRPTTISWLWRGGIILLILVTLADFFIHTHAYFEIDGSFGFYSWYGFIVCVAMVIFAKGLGMFLKVKDTYYDDE